MGITYISGTVTGPKGQCILDFFVYSGATCTLLLFDLWQGITKLERQVSECHIAPLMA